MINCLAFICGIESQVLIPTFLYLHIWEPKYAIIKLWYNGPMYYEQFSIIRAYESKFLKDMGPSFVLFLPHIWLIYIPHFQIAVE